MKVGESVSATGWSIRMDRALLITLILGVVLLVGSLLAIFVQIDGAHREIERGIFSTERETGFLIDKVPTDAWGSFFARVAYSIHDNLHVASGLGLLGVLLLGWAARRIGRWSDVPLGLIAGSVLLPVAVGLVAGLLGLGRSDPLLEQLFEALTGQSLPNNRGCFSTLTTCSHVRAIERIWTLIAAITCVVTAAIFVLAARRAWVIGERGTTLPRAWALASMTLFGLGAVSLLASTPYAADHARAAHECDDDDGWSIPNTTSSDLHGVLVETCSGHPWANYLDADGFLAIRILAEFQVFPDGSVSDLPYRAPVEFLTPDELAASLRPSVELYQRSAVPGDPELVVTLYIDERTPATAIREHLRAVRAAGVTTIILYGQTQVEGSLETIGSWTRRGLCPIATIHLDDDAALEPNDFETWGEIITQAIALGPEPVRIQP